MKRRTHREWNENENWHESEEISQRKQRDCKATRDVGSISVADQRHEPQGQRTEQ